MSQTILAIPTRRAVSATLLLLVVTTGCPGTLDTPLNSLVALAADFNLDQPPTRPIVDEKPILRSRPLFSTIPNKFESHAPTLIAFDDGELLAAWYSYDGPHELTGSAIFMSRRNAGETQWSEPALHIDRPQGDGNPVLYHEGDHDWYFQAIVPGGWSTSRIAWQESDDRGRTWSEPRAIDGPLGATVRFQPLRTAEGDLLLPAYDDLFNRSLFFAWDGDTWGMRSTIRTSVLFPNIQPAVVRLADDSLLAVMRGGESSWLWASRSRDHGRTWTTPVNSGFPNDNSSTALLKLHNGELVLAFNDPHQPGHPLYAALSADEGRTWLPLRTLTTGPGKYTYPVLAEGPDGLIHVVYSDDRKRIGHIEINRAFLIDGQ